MLKDLKIKKQKGTQRFKITSRLKKNLKTASLSLNLNAQSLQLIKAALQCIHFHQAACLDFRPRWPRCAHNPVQRSWETVCGTGAAWCIRWRRPLLIAQGQGTGGIVCHQWGRSLQLGHHPWQLEHSYHRPDGCCLCNSSLRESKG